MFGSHRSPVSAYADVGIETSVHTADPHQLIVLLFNGARAALGVARHAMEQNKVDTRGIAISKAINIISNGLKVSLNKDQEGDLVTKLDALYDYMTRRLLYANLHSDLEALEEVDNLLGEIQGAWVEIADQARAMAENP